MKTKIITALIVSLYATACDNNDASTPTPVTPVVEEWKTSAPFTGDGRDYAAGFAIGGKGYIGTGKKGTTFYKDFWEYDPSTNQWTQKQDFPGDNRTDALAFGMGTKGYMGTGSKVGTFQKDFWEFDPVNNNWKRMDDFPEARDHVVGFVVNGKGYAGLGINVTEGVYSYPKDFYEFNPAAEAGKQWSKKADIGNNTYDQLPGGAGKGFSFTIKNKGYLGIDMANGKYDFWEYDVAQNNWVSKAQLKESVVQGSLVSFSVSDLGYVQSGVKMLHYDASGDRWILKKDLPASLRYNTGFAIGENAYVGLGTGIGTSAQGFYKYIPGTN